jgi:nucleoside-diphosphate-sugar epimerase
VEIVLCDVLDTESIGRAMTGASCVIHCVSGSREAIVQGTANVLEVAQAHKVRRFVQLSTTEVYGNVSGEIDETFPWQYTGNPYGDGKIDAEKMCWEYCAKGLPVTVIRPSIVYGPFGKDWTGRLSLQLLSGNWGAFKGHGEGICNLVYVRDLVSGIMLACRDERAIGEAFNLTGSESVTWNQYFRRFDAALGLPELGTIGAVDATLRAAIMEPVRSLGRYALSHFRDPLRKVSQEHRTARGLMLYADRLLKTTPRIAELSLYSRDALYLTTKARDWLGYQPVFDLGRGLEVTVQWLNYMGLVNQHL